LLSEQDCALVIREQLSEVEEQAAPPYEAIRWPSEVAQRHLADLPTTKEKEKL